MGSISLFKIVQPSFTDAYNLLVSQNHPVPLSFKFLDVSEILEKEQERYKKVYSEKVKECSTGEIDENGIPMLDPEKQKIASKEITDFCKETMIEFPDITKAEIAHATIEPKDLRILLGLIIP